MIISLSRSANKVGNMNEKHQLPFVFRIGKRKKSYKVIGRIKMEKELFEELKGSLSEALDHAKGKKKDLRTTILPAPPKEMSREKRLRN